MSTAQASPTGDEQSAPPINTVAGTGAAGSAGDNDRAVAAQLNRPYGMAVDSTGTVYVCEFAGHRVRKITTDGRISTVAGTGRAGFSGDNGPAASAQLNSPREVAVDREDAVYVADAGNNRIRKITADGTITTVAGTSTAGFAGDGGPATAARLSGPFGVAVDSTGTVYFSDYYNNRVRKVAPDGTISSVAGNGTGAYRGDGGPATAAQLKGPHAVVLDSAGELYIADYGNNRVRRVAADGTISTVAGTGAAGFGGDDGPAASAKLSGPTGVVVDSAGDLYVADYGNNRVRRVAADGTISTVAGTGTAGFGGDDGPAASAQLDKPIALAVDCVDTLYIADFTNNRVRKIASGKLAGLPESGTVVSWANIRSRLRMGVLRESTKDGAEIHQTLAAPRDHQRWRLVAAGQDDGDILYRIENVRSRKVLEVLGAQEMSGAVVVQRSYEGGGAHHQHWRLIPVGSQDGAPQVYEIANHKSGLLLRVDTNARASVKQDGADGDHRARRWQLLPA
ncbi:RICIN domain-containing protein [Streptomyces griseoluteus]|uniref:NHL domain-containing protein n=1 Tax=Streptomyces TaxID=1883 RepID=UPI000A362236|nr:RICIN domain-containing protein [Streptomyces recifensis]